MWCNKFFFFFQAEDGIRDIGVTGVQTCALPILPLHVPAPVRRPRRLSLLAVLDEAGRRSDRVSDLAAALDIVGARWALLVDRKSTRLNSSHANISYAVFCLKKKKTRSRLRSVF